MTISGSTMVFYDASDVKDTTICSCSISGDDYNVSAIYGRNMEVNMVRFVVISLKKIFSTLRLYADVLRWSNGERWIKS